MDRRNFIRSAAFAATTLPPLTKLTQVAEPVEAKPVEAQVAEPVEARWAMGWILWRDYAAKQIPLAQAITELKALGLQGIEFTPRKDELSKQGFSPESFKALLQKNNLAVSGHYFSAPFFDPAQNKETLAAFQEKLDSLKFFGAKNIIIGPPGVKSAQNTDAPIDKMAVLINELGKIAVDQGFEIGIHPHVGTIIETPEQTRQIMSLTDPKYVFFSPDTGHIQLGGGDVLETLKAYKNRINYFHFKDVAGKPEKPFSGNIRELGNGEIDFPAIMKFLGQIRYKGWINVEQDRTKLTPEVSAAQSAEYIRKKLKAL